MNGFTVRLGWTFSFKDKLVKYEHMHPSKKFTHLHLVKWYNPLRLFPYYRVGTFKCYFITFKELKKLRDGLDAIVVASYELPEIPVIVVYASQHSQEHIPL